MSSVATFSMKGFAPFPSPNYQGFMQSPGAFVKSPVASAVAQPSPAAAASPVAAAVAEEGARKDRLKQWYRLRIVPAADAVRKFGASLWGLLMALVRRICQLLSIPLNVLRNASADPQDAREMEVEATPQQAQQLSQGIDSMLNADSTKDVLSNDEKAAAAKLAADFEAKNASIVKFESDWVKGHPNLPLMDAVNSNAWPETDQYAKDLNVCKEIVMNAVAMAQRNPACLALFSPLLQQCVEASLQDVKNHLAQESGAIEHIAKIYFENDSFAKHFTQNWFHNQDNAKYHQDGFDHFIEEHKSTLAAPYNEAVIKREAALASGIEFFNASQGNAPSIPEEFKKVIEDSIAAQKMQSSNRNTEVANQNEQKDVAQIYNSSSLVAQSTKLNSDNSVYENIGFARNVIKMQPGAAKAPRFDASAHIPSGTSSLPVVLPVFHEESLRNPEGDTDLPKSRFGTKFASKVVPANMAEGYESDASDMFDDDVQTTELKGTTAQREVFRS